MRSSNSGSTQVGSRLGSNISLGWWWVDIDKHASLFRRFVADARDFRSSLQQESLKVTVDLKMMLFIRLLFFQIKSGSQELANTSINICEYFLEVALRCIHTSDLNCPILKLATLNN